LIKINPLFFTTIVGGFSGQNFTCVNAVDQKCQNLSLWSRQEKLPYFGAISLNGLCNKDDGQRFINTPALIIDDEADNASIISGKTVKDHSWSK
jgi:hypothetical protein